MSVHHVEVHIRPRPGLLDPEGKAIHNAARSLGWASVGDVRVGKAIYVEIEADDREAALATADEMCRKFLANPVTEDYEVSVVDAPTTSAATGDGR